MMTRYTIYVIGVEEAEEKKNGTETILGDEEIAQ
jgi:hypothetical protein